MLQNLLLSLDIFVCAALVAVVLMQRSEGGALGTSSGPTGLITTRGVGDLLTRLTWGLAIAFALLSLTLTIVEGRDRSNEAILNRLKLQSINPDAVANHPVAPATTAPPVTVPGAPLAPVAAPPALQMPAPQVAPTAAPAVQRPAAAAATTHPAATRTAAPVARSATPAAAPPPVAAAPAPAAAAEAPPPVITPPPRVSPQSAPSATPAPKTDSDAPVTHHEP